MIKLEFNNKDYSRLARPESSLDAIEEEKKDSPSEKQSEKQSIIASDSPLLQKGFVKRYSGSSSIINQDLDLIGPDSPKLLVPKPNLQLSNNQINPI